MANNVQNIKIEPCNVLWQIEEQWIVKTIADVASNLQNQWFKVFLNETQWKHVWYNVATLGVDPAPAGSQGGIVVAIAANATASAVATATASAVDGDTAFVATASGDEVTITNATPGQVGEMVDGAATTGFTFTQTQDGGDLDLGYLDGDIEMSFEESQLDINSHQTGLTPLASLRQGLVNEITLTMKEVSNVAKLREIILGTAGGTDTPSGGTEVFGWGTASLGGNTIVKSRRVILHPVNAGSSKAKDICFWKGYALPDSLVISGENPRQLALTFKSYKDDSKPEAINQWVIGDWSQYLPGA